MLTLLMFASGNLSFCKFSRPQMWPFYSRALSPHLLNLLQLLGRNVSPVDLVAFWVIDQLVETTEP